MTAQASSRWDEAARLEAYRGVIGEWQLQNSAFARCLSPLLVALDWFGAPRTLVPGLPEDGQELGRGDLQALLEAHGFSTGPVSLEEGIGGSLPVPTLAVTGSDCRVYLGSTDGQSWWHNGETIEAWQPPEDAELIAVRENPDFIPVDAPNANWFSQLLGKTRAELTGVVWLSLIINIMALAISLFTMTVYNKIIPTGVASNVWAVGFAAIIGVTGGWMLRLGRASVLARLSAWLGTQIGSATFRKTLGLPLEQTSPLGVNNSLTRLRGLEGLRQFFGASGATVLVDIPFVVIFLLVIAILGGPIVIVPLIGLALIAAFGFVLNPLVRQRSAKASRISNKLNEEIASSVRHLRSLQGISSNRLWLARIRSLAVQAAEHNRELQATQGLMQAVGQGLSLLTVLGTMAVGVSLVLSGNMNSGGLIASMLLIWRITTPAQQFFSLSTRFGQLGDSAKQLQRLMAAAGEMQNPQIVSPVVGLQSGVQGDRLYYRYSADQEAALGSISFDIEQGDCLAVVGPNGSGKSTLLQLLAGIRKPQGGNLLVGGRDIRQFDPADYRSWVGYLPEEPQPFQMTVRQYFQLGHPTVSDEQICSALSGIAGDSWWQLLGADSAGQALDMQPDPYSSNPNHIRARYVLGLAEAVLESPSLLLLDEPVSDGDPLLNEFLLKLLEQVRGKTTVVFVTHRPDLIPQANKILVLDRGNLVHFGEVADESEDQPPTGETTSE